MKSSKQVPIAIIAVLIMLMPTTSLAVAFSSTENVQGEEPVDVPEGTPVTVSSYDGLERELETDITSTITVTGEIFFGGESTIEVAGTHTLQGAGMLLRNFNGSNGSNFKGILLSIPSGASLTLAGSITIDGSGVSGCSPLVTVNGGTFRMEEHSELKNNRVNGDGGAVCVNSGTFTMTGGTINNNTASNRGGGVEVNSTGSSFSMDGGTISNNVAKNGGGVRVDAGASFFMFKGTINGNRAYSAANGDNGNGGGVAVASSNFTLYDGDITNNSATRNTEAGVGSGVFIFQNDDWDSSFSMYGGNLIGNHGYGYNESPHTYDGVGDQIYIKDARSSFIIAGGEISVGSQTLSDTNKGSAIYLGNLVSGSGTTETTSHMAGTMTGEVTINGQVYVTSGTTISRSETLCTEMSIYYDGGTYIDKEVRALINDGNIEEDPNTSNADFESIIGDVFGENINVSGRTEIYVSSGGSDNNDGLTSETPVKTLVGVFKTLKFQCVDGKDVKIYVKGSLEVGARDKVILTKDRLEYNGVIVPLSPTSMTFLRDGVNSVSMLFVNGGELTIDDITISGADANDLALEGCGYLININGGNVVIEDGAKLTKNCTSAINSYSSGVLRLNGEISYCEAVMGGAIYTRGGSTVTIAGAIHHCKSTSNGGAINAVATTMTIKDGAQICNNSAGTGGSGGAVRFQSDGKTLTMEGGTVAGNTAGRNGSAFSIASGEFIIESGFIIGNVAGNESPLVAEENYSRGAVHLFESTDTNSTSFRMEGGTISGNKSLSVMNYRLGSLQSQIAAIGAIEVDICGGVIADYVKVHDDENNCDVDAVEEYGSVLFVGSSTDDITTVNVHSGYEGVLKVFGGRDKMKATYLRLPIMVIDNNTVCDSAGHIKVTCTYNGNVSNVGATNLCMEGNCSADVTFEDEYEYSHYDRISDPNFNILESKTVSFADIIATPYDDGEDDDTVIIDWFTIRSLTVVNNMQGDIPISGLPENGYSFSGDKLTITASFEITVANTAGLVIDDVAFDAAVEHDSSILTYTWEYTVGNADVDMVFTFALRELAVTVMRGDSIITDGSIDTVSLTGIRDHDGDGDDDGYDCEVTYTILAYGNDGLKVDLDYIGINSGLLVFSSASWLDAQTTEIKFKLIGTESGSFRVSVYASAGVCSSESSFFINVLPPIGVVTEPMV